jgi:SAM-dependent methyltransferase
MSRVPLGARLRLLLAGLSPRGTSVTPLLPDDRYQTSLSLYRFVSERAADGEVLELGSGTGFGCAEIARSGARRVVGVERWERLTRHARRRYGGGGVTFVTAPLETPPELGRFDLACALGVAAQSPDAESLLVALRRSLRDERGRAVISVPLLRSSEEIDAAVAGGVRNALYPWYWAGLLGEHFRRVYCYRHEPRAGAYPDASSRSPSRLRPADFGFVQVASVEELVEGPGLAAVLEGVEPR